MSIRQVQIKNMLDLVAQSHFVGGVNPQLNELLKYMSQYFAKYPPGLPITLTENTFIDNQRSNEVALNDAMAQEIVNLDVLYETSLQHLDEILMLNTVLKTHLDRLKIRRHTLESKVDDFLLGLYNSDGYFYSVSDQFIDLSLTDTNLTSAYIDTDTGEVSLPTLNSLTNRITIDRILIPTVNVSDEFNNTIPFVEKSPFSNAVDGLTNTAYFFQVEVHDPRPLTAVITVGLGTTLGSTRVTRVDVNPFGVTPVKVAVGASYINENTYISTRVPFSNTVKTSVDKMTFIGEQIQGDMESITLTIVKDAPDYTVNTGGVLMHVYQFGFKELAFTEQVYDQTAVFVSSPISLPTELADDSVIDAVSLVSEEVVPSNTAVKYFIAANVSDSENISDFDWRSITPIGGSLATNKNYIVNFNGAAITNIMIRKTPVSISDIQLIEFNNTAEDLSKRNPAPDIVEDADVYRLATFQDFFLSGSIKLEEGINTTKIYYTELDEDAVAEGFEFWKEKFKDATSYSTTFGRIDVGHEFFYGGDVGEGGKSVFVEAFVDVSTEYPILLKNCSKSDTNARLWDMRVFLNGREIANMPAGVHNLTVPWRFLQGRNHVAILLNIPEVSVEFPTPYIGTIDLMSDDELHDFGVVKLETWNYVDFFKFKNNEVNDPKSFTIYNDEIVSRRKPTDNFRLTFAKGTSGGPTAIRLRMDLSRSNFYANATPLVDSYRLRFSYGD